MGPSSPISSFYRRWAITRGGFVITARGLGDYPRAIRAKLLRELGSNATIGPMMIGVEKRSNGRIASASTGVNSK